MTAKKKSDTSNKTRKQNNKKQVTPVVVTEQSAKDLFISEAKNTTFTEEDLKVLEAAKLEEKSTETFDVYNVPINIEKENSEEEIQNVENCEAASNVIIENSESQYYIPSVQFADHVGEEIPTDNNDEPCSAVTIDSYCIDNSDFTSVGVGGITTFTNYNPEEIVSDWAEVIIPEEPKKKEELTPKKKKRSTSTQVYGYHWMGQIYGE